MPSPVEFTIGLIHALPPVARRCFNRREAASYINVSPTHFEKMVHKGAMPQPMSDFDRRRVWDKHAIDRALDARSHIYSNAASGNEDPLDSELAEWRAKNGRR